MPGPLALLALQAAPGIIGGISQLFGKKRRKREEERASKRISSLTDMFKSQLGEDYFDSTEAMGAMKQIDNNASENFDQINATANVNGLTDEARIAMMGQNLRAKQGAYAGLAGQANLWRQRNMQNYAGSLNQLFSVGQKNRQNFNGSMQNILGNLQSGVDGAVNAGAFDTWLGK